MSARCTFRLRFDDDNGDDENDVRSVVKLHGTQMISLGTIISGNWVDRMYGYPLNFLASSYHTDCIIPRLTITRQAQLSFIDGDKALCSLSATVR